MHRQRLTIATLVLLLAGGAAAAVAYRHDPPPSVLESSPDDRHALKAFIASDEFATLSDRNRIRVAEAYLDTLRPLDFQTLWAESIRFDPDRRAMWRHLWSLPDAHRVSGAFLALFLDKYAELDPKQKPAMLTTIAVAQQTRILRDPQAFGLPAADEFKRDMSRFMSRQSPRVQGQMGQFLIDLKRQRDMLGLPDPF